MGKINPSVKTIITNAIKRNIPVEEDSLLVLYDDRQRNKYFLEYMTTTAKNKIEITKDDFDGIIEQYSDKL
jgi:hypothetical protein